MRDPWWVAAIGLRCLACFSFAEIFWVSVLRLLFCCWVLLFYVFYIPSDLLVRLWVYTAGCWQWRFTEDPQLCPRGIAGRKNHSSHCRQNKQQTKRRDIYRRRCPLPTMKTILRRRLFDRISADKGRPAWPAGWVRCGLKHHSTGTKTAAGPVADHVYALSWRCNCPMLERTGALSR